jgi:hypothetical protein
MASGATCVQRLDGSRDSAIHTRYRISLRSSSMREPRYPLPRVMWVNSSYRGTPPAGQGRPGGARGVAVFLDAFGAVGSFAATRLPPAPPPWEGRGGGQDRGPRAGHVAVPGGRGDAFAVCFGQGHDNDPSAGSPTETLLRLLLPLNDKVQWTSRDVGGGEPPPSPRSEHFTGPFNR